MAEDNLVLHGEIIEPETVRVTRMLPAPIEKVWAYLTESEKRARWFAGGAFDLRIGGRTELRFDHSKLSREASPDEYKKYDGSIAYYGEITAIDPPRLLTWRDEGEAGLAEVTFELTPRGDRTLLVITNTKLPKRKDRVGNASGWEAHVNILEDVLNGVTPRGFWTMHAALERAYEARVP